MVLTRPLLSENIGALPRAHLDFIERQMQALGAGLSPCLRLRTGLVLRRCGPGGPEREHFDEHRQRG